MELEANRAGNKESRHCLAAYSFNTRRTTNTKATVVVEKIGNYSAHGTDRRDAQDPAEYWSCPLSVVERNHTMLACYAVGWRDHSPDRNCCSHTENSSITCLANSWFEHKD